MGGGILKWNSPDPTPVARPAGDREYRGPDLAAGRDAAESYHLSPC